MAAKFKHYWPGAPSEVTSLSSRGLCLEASCPCCDYPACFTKTDLEAIVIGTRTEFIECDNCHSVSSVKAVARQFVESQT